MSAWFSNENTHFLLLNYVAVYKCDDILLQKRARSLVTESDKFLQRQLTPYLVKMTQDFVMPRIGRNLHARN